MESAIDPRFESLAISVGSIADWLFTLFFFFWQLSISISN